MNVFFIRHGESTANIHHMHAGWSDVPLTQQGCRQAVETKKLLQGISFDYIFTSDLVRARKTAELIFGPENLVISQELREINMEPISGMSQETLTALYGNTYLQGLKTWDFSALGCESVPHFQARCAVFFRKLEGIERADNIAVVTHAGIIRMLSHKVLNTDFANRTYMKLQNASITVFSYQKKSGWQLLKWNYTPAIL